MQKSLLLSSEISSNVFVAVINLLSKEIKLVDIASQSFESDSIGMIDSGMCSGVVSRSLFVLTMCLN